MNNIKIKDYNFTLLKGRKADAIIEEYNHFKSLTFGNSLFEVYKTSWSNEKEEALNNCKKMVSECEGFGCCFGRASGWVFSYMFKLDYNEKTYIVKITRDNNFICEAMQKCF